MGVVHVLRFSKEELAWATDKQLQVIDNIMLFQTVTVYYKGTKE